MNIKLADPSYFRRARFLKSAHQITDLPADQGADILIAGRSNVGKSSLLNALCDQRELAHTSRTPGRTQQIVIFDLGDNRRLLDLPGFGYAAVPREIKAHWDVVIPQVLEQRFALAGLVLVADARAGLKDEEKQLLSWSARAQLPVLLALNKLDKLTRQNALRAVAEMQTAVAGLRLDVLVVGVSAAKKLGLSPITVWMHAHLERKLKEGPGHNT